MKEYETIIGLEVHAELNTESKIYCSCRNVFGDKANTHICPVCMGLPGALPILNEKVVDYAIKMGHALNCKINRLSRQDRKNYFYPDLPKAYQIIQSDIPLCENGYIDIIINGKTKRIGITRIHIEEDAGKLIHEENEKGTLVDFNRCGVPLIEIVTEPDLRSADEAKKFLDTIKNILKYIDISDCRMQEGSLRCDVNVSVRKKGTKDLGTRCEMKNVNSFSSALRGIIYESKRQIDILERGESIVRETRRWDDAKGKSFTMRTKENARDYRFFPEPDLQYIYIEEEKVNKLKNSIPELPNEKIARYIKEHNLSETDAYLIAESKEKAELYDNCVTIGECIPKNISNWILTDISRYLKETGKKINETHITAENLSTLISKIESGVISNTAARTVFAAMIDDGGECEKIIDELGLSQNSDIMSLKNIVNETLNNNEKSVNDYYNGKTKVIGYLIGQCMKKSSGRANPTIIKELVTEALKKNKPEY